MTRISDGRVDELIRVACNCAGYPEFAAEITWSWNPRFTSHWGKAHLERNHIELAKKIFDIVSEDHQVDTVLHEVAHLLTIPAYGYETAIHVACHGPEWQEVAKVVGAKPLASAPHLPELMRIKRRRNFHFMSCECGTFAHSKKMWKNRNLICGRCYRRPRKLEVFYGRPDQAEERCKELTCDNS